MQQKARVVRTPGGLEFYSPYHKLLVAELKSKVPYSERKPIYIDGKFSHWMVDQKHASLLNSLCVLHLNSPPTIQGQLYSNQPQETTKILEVKYIGTPKDRGNQRTASGWVDGQWYAIFPETSLRAYFEPGMEHHDTQTRYGILAVSLGASGSEIKKAYRKMAKRFHPDINQDEDAAEMFIRIQESYEILRNPRKRRKYDAGLVFAASLRGTTPNTRQNYWRPPLRCGLIMVNGVEKLGRFIVDKIIQWEPIKDEQGRELITSWPIGEDHFIEKWEYI